MVDTSRTRLRNTKPVGEGAVVYWMQRDQRADENWALLYAQEQAAERNVPLYVVFNLVKEFGEARLRHYDFMFRGLKETEKRLNELKIPFILLRGEPKETIPAFVEKCKVGQVVVDFNPLQFTDAWREEAGKKLPVQLVEVDAHNIVPCWVASDKQEFAAYTFRPKVTRKLGEYLKPFPELKQQEVATTIEPSCVNWGVLLEEINIDRNVPAVRWLEPGTSAAKKTLKDFFEKKLERYDDLRNDPNEEVQSNLSPYLHFGQIAPQWVALETKRVEGMKESKDAFLEELIVRRELTDNYCFYNPNYDKVEGAHVWAQKTIAEHADDAREHLYERAELEDSKTHDDLWNAMQLQLVEEGKLHGWCRMYWAKKILEWSPSAQTAIDRALYLNDKYELDGNDPNGVVGVMWSIAGVHDRAWNERPIFGKIRYMNYAGAKRKFKVDDYIARYIETQNLFNE